MYSPRHKATLTGTNGNTIILTGSIYHPNWQSYPAHIYVFFIGLCLCHVTKVRTMIFSSWSKRYCSLQYIVVFREFLYQLCDVDGSIFSEVVWKYDKLHKQITLYIIYNVYGHTVLLRNNSTKNAFQLCSERVQVAVQRREAFKS